MAIAIEDIDDHESLKAWLDAFPGTEEERYQAAVFIAARAATRVLPIAWTSFEYHSWARKRDLTAIPLLRSLLISGVAVQMSNPDIRAAATAYAAAADATAAAAYAAYADATAAFAFAAAAAVATADATAAYATAAFAAADATDAAAAAFAADAAAYAAATATDSWNGIRKDCAQIQKRDDEGRFSVFARGLWDGDKNPLPEKWVDLKSKLGSDTDIDWSFWINWYEDLLHGREPNWELLYDVATSEAVDWDASSAEVNAAIGVIVDKHRLLGEVRALKAEKEVYLGTMATEAHRSHNLPPEGLVDDEPRLVITMLWDALDEAEDALDTPSPDPSLLRKVGEKLVQIAAAIAKYCGQKVDLFVSEAVKETGKAAGKWGSGAIAAYLAAQTEPVKALGNGILQLAENLAKIGFGG